MSSQDCTDKKPARTDTFAESLHPCREAGKMAQRQPTWRPRGAQAVHMALGASHSSPVQVSTHTLRDACSPRCQRLRESLSANPDDLVAILAPGHRHDPFRP